MGNRTEVLAMLLAGGQGSRLKNLTKHTAKPAVPYGGKYRIIDFALSNAANSGVSNIAILTQYKPLQLNEHLGIGEPWDYNRSPVGMKILSPFASEEGGRWFTGTANAIYENLDYIDSMDPTYVVILSGDHIYKMNYMKMVRAHKENKADCTISVIEVPWEDASRFGIVNLGENGRIVEFDEKPAHPKNNMASMGIYVFTWNVLRKYLIEDERDEASDHDFGKNILPKMLADGKDMHAFLFKGYWKDVGTVRSYWESNLDLLNPYNDLDIFENDWRIYTNNLNLPPHRIGKNAHISEALINEACRIYGTVIKSVLFSNVTIEEGAEVVNSVVQSNVVIKSGARVENAIVMENLTIESGTRIGDGERVSLISEDGITEE
ncbi:Glucose-1-phosphate adenylyltransferase [Aedoeadaptatus ivorii]|uniref:Glucose-1-phosphate adenylyltransferase n=1 Tax=Aedoeadaptatus ivorii TaxID=54006 RepID=A0A448V012_9FIRM|nr:glucose-1-phosphate adenylyltransferase [Peptoniphilus ivorii]VEJ34461.1 Glucose-1-phosphate adenylyltransferase [Peptoniphilus ivorii]